MRERHEVRPSPGVTGVTATPPTRRDDPTHHELRVTEAGRLWCDGADGRRFLVRRDASFACLEQMETTAYNVIVAAL